MAQARDRGVAAERWQPLRGARLADPVRRGLVRSLWMDICTIIIAMIAQGLVEASARSRVPAVDLGRGLLRCGRRTVAFAAIDRAHLGLMEVQDGVIGLRLRSDRIDVFVPLILENRVVLEAETRDLLLAMLPQTTIAMPVDRYDPSGRFARYNFPGFVTRERAIEIVADPAIARDELGSWAV